MRTLFEIGVDILLLIVLLLFFIHYAPRLERLIHWPDAVVDSAFKRMSGYAVPYID